MVPAFTGAEIIGPLDEITKVSSPLDRQLSPGFRVVRLPVATALYASQTVRRQDSVSPPDRHDPEMFDQIIFASAGTPPT
jgi:hypothetical protein